MGGSEAPVGLDSASMRYWWVNQTKTYRHEVPGGYLWSPKLKANGNRNPFYEQMREVAPGDLVLSFADTRIRAIGIARSFAYEAPKPIAFGAAGRDWDDIGWRVDVTFKELATDFRPAAWIEVLRPLLPERYSPLLPDGRGLQSVYLTRLPTALALRLADLIGGDVAALARSEAVADADMPVPLPEVILWEEHLRKTIEADPTLPSTEREALVIARRGQGMFRELVQQFEQCCRITGVARPEHLRASHTKPWRDSSNAERLDGENGLLLTPSIDHLFDRGFISFRDDGRPLISPVAHLPSLAKMGVVEGRQAECGGFTSRQKVFLGHHRDAVFLRAQLAGE
jgi:hypothetical protein